MANTTVQLNAEKYIRENELPKQYIGHTFTKKKLCLKVGGKFEFDAVSEDESIVVCISTSKGITSGGNVPSAKIQKIRSDALWFYMLEKPPKKKVLAFTDKGMHDLIQKAQNKKRFPSDIELLPITLETELAKKVRKAQARASKEMSLRIGKERIFRRSSQRLTLLETPKC